jgi:hypothetical protein
MAWRGGGGYCGDRISDNLGSDEMSDTMGSDEMSEPMSIGDAVKIARECEGREHRASGDYRGRIVHEAFEVIFQAVESALGANKMQLK